VAPREGSRSNFAQLFLLDDMEATNKRINFPGREECNPAIMLQISQYMTLNNPFVATYKNMLQLMREQEQVAMQSGVQPPILTLYIQQNPSDDPRTYNLPTHNEVAILFPTNQNPSHRDIKVHTRHNSNLTIPQTSPSIDPLCYPIFYPNGDSGWTNGIPYTSARTRETMSLCEFHAYRLAFCSYIWNPLHYGRRLFKQLLVDLFCRVEGSRLSFLRRNQAAIRTDQYQGLLDYVQGENRV
jgi:Helitron helicase-like domain at N-terminus